MSGIGIEKFRDIGAASFGTDRRVTLDAGGQGVTAPYTFAGRVVTWFQGRSAPPGEAAANTQVRQAFCDALAKSYGRETANEAIRSLHAKGMPDFAKSTRTLTSGRVAEMLDRADAIRLRKGHQAVNLARKFVDGGNLATAATIAGKNAGHASLTPRDHLAIRQEFARQFNGYAGFGHKAFSRDQFIQLAAEATERYCVAKERRFAEAYPGLVEANTGLTHDRDTFFDAMRARLEKPPLGGEPDRFRHFADEALGQIEAATKDLSRMTFNVDQAEVLRLEVLGRRDMLNDIRQKLDNLADISDADIPATTEGVALAVGLMDELDHQVVLLEAKAEFLDQYRQHDPLSDKAVAYNKLVWAQASHRLLSDEIGKLANRYATSKDPAEQAQLQTSMTALRAARDDRLTAAEHDHDHASPTQRSVTSEKPGRFRPPHPLQQQAIDERRFVEQTLRTAGLPADGLSGRMQQAQVTALNEIQDWEVIRRDMVVAREGVTRTYRSEMTPGSKLEGPVGRAYAEHGLKGVSAATKEEAQHARNLQVSKLYEVKVGNDGQERTVLKHSSIRHGVLDMWKIRDPALRQQANEAAAKEVITVAATMDDAFKAGLLAKAADKAAAAPVQKPPSKLVHVNFNETTADNIRGLTGDYAEGTYTDAQFGAFKSQDGLQTLKIEGDDGGMHDVEVDVSTITFSFGVNPLAMNKAADALGATWSRVDKHNRENMAKLVGDLTPNTEPGGQIGEIVERLKAARASADADGAKQIDGLIADLRRETDLVRRLFNSGEYKSGIEDAYKMTRHTMRLLDLGAEALKEIGDSDMALTKSQGCKSAKDRGGMADVEIKALTIIEDMGGEIKPGKAPEGEDRTIYNTVLTSSGQDRVQQLNTGLPGSKNAGDVRGRIGDADAVEYAKAYGGFAKA